MYICDLFCLRTVIFFFFWFFYDTFVHHTQWNTFHTRQKKANKQHKIRKAMTFHGNEWNKLNKKLASIATVKESFNSRNIVLTIFQNKRATNKITTVKTSIQCTRTFVEISEKENDYVRIWNENKLKKIETGSYKHCIWTHKEEQWNIFKTIFSGKLCCVSFFNILNMSMCKCACCERYQHTQRERRTQRDRIWWKWHTGLFVQISNRK